MKTVFLIISIIISSISFGQNTKETKLVEKTLQGYYEAFYEGKLSSFTKIASKEIHKYGYWKTNGKFVGEPLTYEDMVKYVKRIKTESNDRDISIKEIKIFDILENTASAKLKFWWGYDYILLAKEKDEWKVRMVLWEGPLK